MQPKREPHAEGSGRCQHQAGLGSDECGGRASGRATIQAIIDGEQNPGLLADMAKGRDKVSERQSALAGRISAHHRFLLTHLMDNLRPAELKIERVEEEIKRHTFPFGGDVDRLRTIPGIDRVRAWGLLAELGQNMDEFPSAGTRPRGPVCVRAISKSAGKRLSGKTRKESAFSAPLLDECRLRCMRVAACRLCSGVWPPGGAISGRFWR